MSAHTAVAAVTAAEEPITPEPDSMFAFHLVASPLDDHATSRRHEFPPAEE